VKILLTNDDGIDALGLIELFRALDEEHDCLMVAPVSEKSASSHSISLGQKLVIDELAPDRFAVHGTPADCVKFALAELKHFKPDLLISGINPGPNTGVSVYYSGTISAAREGLINDVPSMAVSIGWKKNVPLSTPFSEIFSRAASFILSLLKGRKKAPFPAGILLNINFPALPASQIRGIKVTRQAHSRFIEEFIRGNASDHKRVYTLAGEIKVSDPDGTTDEEVVSEGFISVTPLKLDLTDFSQMPILEQWIRHQEESWLAPKNT